MKLEIQKQLTVTLSLNSKEVKMLKDMIQNPICEDEPKEDREFRENLFLTLKGALE